MELKKWKSILNSSSCGPYKKCCICRNYLFQNRINYPCGYCSLILLKCDHIYHTYCLDLWIRRQNCCPLDNKEIKVKTNLITFSLDKIFLAILDSEENKVTKKKSINLIKWTIESHKFFHIRLKKGIETIFLIFSLKLKKFVPKLLLFVIIDLFVHLELSTKYLEC